MTGITDNVLLGDVGQRPGLSPRDRSLTTVASLISLYRVNELPFHLKKAFENGIGRDELIEIITHLAFYSGWPTASTALSVARRFFEEASAQKTHCRDAGNQMSGLHRLRKKTAPFWGAAPLPCVSLPVRHIRVRHSL
jgi:4-carboxymuconolactone decarboxylase